MARLCIYGCGKEAKFQLKNGKWCCSPSRNSCQREREKNRSSNLGRISNRKGKTYEEIFGEEKATKILAKKRRKKNFWKGKKRRPKTKEEKETLRIKMIGRGKGKSKPTKGKTYEEILGKERSRNLLLVRRKAVLGSNNPAKKLEVRQKISYSVKECWKDKNSVFNSKSYREKIRRRMTKWQSVWMNKFLKNPSSQQVRLWKICCSILPNPILNYPFYRGKGKRSYSLDIADSRLGIVIEFDGWRGHFDSKKSINYHRKRQKEVEEDGWKFLRYNVFRPFPTKEQVQKDIKSILT